MKKTAFIGAFILLVGCVTTKVATTAGPSQADVDRVQAKFPGYTLTDLNEGKTLYEKHCGICHALEAPAKHSEEEWRKEVPPMVIKVNKKQGNVLDAKGEELILKYVVTMSGAK